MWLLGFLVTGIPTVLRWLLTLALLCVSLMASEIEHFMFSMAYFAYFISPVIDEAVWFLVV